MYPEFDLNDIRFMSSQPISCLIQVRPSLWWGILKLCLFESNIKVFIKFTNGNLSRKFDEHKTFSFQPCERA